MSYLNRIIAGRTYRFAPVPLDTLDPHSDLTPGELVTVINAHGCPHAGTMAHCHVVRRSTGKFAGLVHVNSLEPVSLVPARSSGR